MKIQDLDIKSIKAYSKNPRKNDAAVDAAAGRIGVKHWRAAAMIERNHIYKMDCRDGLREMVRGGALIALSPKWRRTTR